MMGLGKPQRLAKFDVAGFICYGNIREFVFKNWDKPKCGKPLLFGETDFTVRFADPIFPIRCATVVEIRLQQIDDFYEKPHFAMENFIFRDSGGSKMGVENFCTKLPKGTPLRQIWSNKLFGVSGSDVVLTLYGGEKKVRENRQWKIGSSITPPRYRDVVIMQICEIPSAKKRIQFLFHRITDAYNRVVAASNSNLG